MMVTRSLRHWGEHMNGSTSLSARAMGWRPEIGRAPTVHPDQETKTPLLSGSCPGDIGGEKRRDRLSLRDIFVPLLAVRRFGALGFDMTIDDSGPPKMPDRQPKRSYLVPPHPFVAAHETFHTMAPSRAWELARVEEIVDSITIDFVLKNTLAVGRPITYSVVLHAVVIQLHCPRQVLSIVGDRLAQRLQALQAGTDRAEVLTAINEYGPRIVGSVPPDQALEVLESCVPWLEADRSFQLLLAQAYTNARQNKRAIELLETLLPTSDADIHYALGRAYFFVGKNNDALASLRTATALAPENSEFHLTLGIVLCFAERLAEAEASMNTAVAIEPRSGVGFRVLGEAIAYHTNDVHRAQEAYAKALSFASTLEEKANIARLIADLTKRPSESSG
jgi:hypothetical protein